MFLLNLNVQTFLDVEHTHVLVHEDHSNVLVHVTTTTQMAFEELSMMYGDVQEDDEDNTELEIELFSFHHFSYLEIEC